MANYLGKDGIIKVNNHTIAEVRSWTINLAADTVEDTTLGCAWKTHKATLKSWHGSLSCFWDRSDSQGQGAMSIGSSINLTLYPEGDNGHHNALVGTAIVTGLDHTGSHSGLLEASINFQGSGALEEEST